MLNLSTADIIELVRKNYDEMEDNFSDMVGEDVDTKMFDEMVAKTIPQAINEIHLEAPVQVLDGKTLTFNELKKVDAHDGMIIIPMTSDFLRLVAFKAVDSPCTIAEAVSAYSPEGMMQLNPYSRASYDRPRIVLSQGRSKAYDYTKTDPVQSGSVTTLIYYSLREDTAVTDNKEYEVIERFEYIPRYREEKTSYDIAEEVVDNVIDRLTGMIMAIYGNTNSKYFLDRSSFSAPVQAPESANKN